MTITITNLAPKIIHAFDSLLLMTFLQRQMHELKTKIFPLVTRKIRPQDTGKAKRFAELLKKHQELYERKKAEEDEYKKKAKEKREKRSSLHVGKTVKFSRFLDTR